MRRETVRDAGRRERPRAPLPVRVALIGAATVAMTALVVTLGRTQTRHGAAATAAARAPVVMLAPVRPIAAEADVFRARPEALAVSDARRRAAHPRTLATLRTIRAYPGAPPRVPHGLTAEEFRAGRCRTCHERGGYSPRFGAYVPVTPHPELEPCLQCHVPDAAVVGLALPGSDPDDVCRQCHAPAAARARLPELDWRPAAWPSVAAAAGPGELPPPIPHDLQLRGNCVACHAGPAAPAEVRTRHAERADCRGCHVTAGGER